MHGNGQNDAVRQGSGDPLCCLRCGAPMKRVDPENYPSGNLLVRQIAKIVNGVHIRIWRCTGCGRLELFQKPGSGERKSGL